MYNFKRNYSQFHYSNFSIFDKIYIYLYFVKKNKIYLYIEYLMLEHIRSSLRMFRSGNTKEFKIYPKILFAS